MCCVLRGFGHVFGQCLGFVLVESKNIHFHLLLFLLDVLFVASLFVTYMVPKHLVVSYFFTCLFCFALVTFAFM